MFRATSRTCASSRLGWLTSSESILATYSPVTRWNPRLSDRVSPRFSWLISTIRSSRYAGDEILDGFRGPVIDNQEFEIP